MSLLLLYPSNLQLRHKPRLSSPEVDFRQSIFPLCGLPLRSFKHETLLETLELTRSRLQVVHFVSAARPTTTIFQTQNANRNAEAHLKSMVGSVEVSAARPTSSSFPHIQSSQNTEHDSAIPAPARLARCSGAGGVAQPRC